ncbi:hypothetical protein EVA_11676, partial [gut metagenome]
QELMDMFAELSGVQMDNDQVLLNK